MTPEGEEIRTIFVTGFPPDAKEREVQNMLRWWPGYEACQLTFKGDQPLGFAIFSTPAMAFAARDALQGLIFDADHNSVLRVELAKTNLHRRKGLPGGGDGYDHSKRSRVDPMAAYMPGAAAAAMGSFMPAAYDAYASSFTPLADHHTFFSPFPPPSPPCPLPACSFMPAAYDAYASSFTPLPAAPAAAPKTYTPLPAPPSGMPGKIYRDNPPCNTLYLGNLGMQVSEAELLQIFSVQPGYVQLKLLRQGMSTCCFVQFVDVDAASAVHTALQGISLASSDRGPVRVQYPHHHHSPTALTHTLPGPIPSCPPALLSPQHASVPFRPTFPLPRFLSPLLSCALFRPIALLVF
ncbi:unnamed protein product [Closterium sp. NIES-54]